MGAPRALPSRGGALRPDRLGERRRRLGRAGRPRPGAAGTGRAGGCAGAARGLPEAGTGDPRRSRARRLRGARGDRSPRPRGPGREEPAGADARSRGSLERDWPLRRARRARHLSPLDARRRRRGERPLPPRRLRAGSRGRQRGPVAQGGGRRRPHRGRERGAGALPPRSRGPERRDTGTEALPGGTRDLGRRLGREGPGLGHQRPGDGRDDVGEVPPDGALRRAAPRSRLLALRSRPRGGPRLPREAARRPHGGRQRASSGARADPAAHRAPVRERRRRPLVPRARREDGLQPGRARGALGPLERHGAASLALHRRGPGGAEPGARQGRGLRPAPARDMPVDLAARSPSRRRPRESRRRPRSRSRGGPEPAGLGRVARDPARPGPGSPLPPGGQRAARLHRGAEGEPPRATSP